MALCPFAEHKLIAPGSSDPRIKPRVAILHVDAGGAKSLFDYFLRRSGGIESHFHIRWDGVIEQYRDTDWEADANFRANAFGISIETQGFGNGTWNKRQLESIKRLLLWLHETHDIPLVKCPAPFGAGVGYHTLFGAPSDWTPVAKSCPGPNRKVQFEEIIVPWLAEASKPPKRTRLEIISANLWRENEHVAEDLEEIRKMRPHLVGVNEGANFVAEITAVEGYQACYGIDPKLKLKNAKRDQLQNPILVRDDVKVTAQGRLMVSAAVGTSPGRSAVWVAYEYGGEKRAHVNTHFNSHVQAGAARARNLPRVTEYIKGVRRVRRLVKALKAQGYKVTLTGDMNWGFLKRRKPWVYSPQVVFKKVGLRAQFAHKTDPARPKGDRRRIEYVFADPKDLVLAGQRFVKREHSDHPYHSVSYFLQEK